MRTNLRKPGVNVNAPNEKGETALHLACKSKDPPSKDRLDILDLLLGSSDVDIEAKDNAGNTPLMLACLANKDELVKRLLDKDADLNVTSFNHSSPLQIAVKRGATPIIGLLLATKKISTDAKCFKDDKWVHPLQVSRGKSMVVASLLTDYFGPLPDGGTSLFGFSSFMVSL